MPVRYAKNVPGDFYVEDGCCMTCGVWLDIAPDIFEFDDSHCFVRKQPATPDEVDRTLEAMNSQEAGCMRYGGSDPEIIRRLVESGEEACCDNQLTAHFSEKIRDIVHVRHTAGSASEFLHALIADARKARRYDGKPYYRFKLPLTPHPTTFRFTWFERYHTVDVYRDSEGVFLLRLKAAPPAWHGLSRVVHGWLKAMPDVTDIWWMSEEERQAGNGQPSPY